MICNYHPSQLPLWLVQGWAGIWGLPLTSHPWKNCLPQNWSLVPKMFGTAVLDPWPILWWAWKSHKEMFWSCPVWSETQKVYSLSTHLHPRPDYPGEGEKNQEQTNKTQVMSMLYHQWPTYGFAAQRELCRQPLVNLKASVPVRNSLQVRGTWTFMRLNSWGNRNLGVISMSMLGGWEVPEDQQTMTCDFQAFGAEHLTASQLWTHPRLVVVEGEQRISGKW